MPTFDLQGHRGARGLKPENTLPAFETAFDLGVGSVETDVRLTRDGVPVLYHDARVGERLCRLVPGSAAPDPASRPAVSDLTLAQLRGYRADRNPDPPCFPEQDAAVTPLAAWFAAERGTDPFAPPTLDDLFAFASAYGGAAGERAGKSEARRQKAREATGFRLELKREPFRDGPGPLVRLVVESVRRAGGAGRTAVISFDHRCVLEARRLEPRLAGAVLTANTAPVSAAALARQADADAYGPEFEFLDERQVREAQSEGVRVVPWTVNEEADMRTLLRWGVDGIATDYPDRLAALLREHGVDY